MEFFLRMQTTEFQHVKIVYSMAETEMYKIMFIKNNVFYDIMVLNFV